MKKVITFLSFLTLFFAIACSNAEQHDAANEESMNEIMEEASDDMVHEMEEEENEREIMASELPEIVANAFKDKYADAEIEEVEEIKDNDGGLTYEIEFESMEQDYEVLFSSNGEFLEESLDEDDDEDEEEDEGEEDDDDTEMN